MKLWMSLGAVAGLFLGACQGNDLGTGANTVVREVAKPAPLAWSAAVECAKAAGLTVASASHDEMGGDIVAHRANSKEVRIQVKSLDEKTCEISVRVEPGDRELANQLHERIAERVGLGEAKAGLFRGNSLEGSYYADLTTAMSCSHQVFTALKVTPTGSETHATWAKLDGRLKDSTPVEIRMENKEDLRLLVHFTAGNERSDDNEAFARRMKEEFGKIFLTVGTQN